MQNYECRGFAENKGLTSFVERDMIRDHVNRKEAPMVYKTDRKPMATAWIDNQHRVVYDIREIRRGKSKGKLECYYRKGKGFQQTLIPKTDIKEALCR